MWSAKSMEGSCITTDQFGNENMKTRLEWGQILAVSASLSGTCYCRLSPEEDQKKKPQVFFPLYSQLSVAFASKARITSAALANSRAS